MEKKYLVLLLLTMLISIGSIYGHWRYLPQANQASRYLAFTNALATQLGDPMSSVQLQRLSSVVSELQAGGDLRRYGLGEQQAGLDSFLQDDGLSAQLEQALASANLRLASQLFEAINQQITAEERRLRIIQVLATALPSLLLLFLSIAYLLFSRIRWQNWLSHVQTSGDSQPVPSSFLSQIHQRVQLFRESTGKQIGLSTSGFVADALPPEFNAVTEPVIMALVQNSLDHALPKASSLEISIDLSQNPLPALRVSDSGVGISVQDVTARAVAIGVLPTGGGSQISLNDALKLLFIKEISEKQKSMFGYRELTFGEMRPIVSRYGGRFQIRNQGELGFEVSIVFDNAEATK